MGFQIVECYDPVTLTKGRNFIPGKFAPPPPPPPLLHPPLKRRIYFLPL